MKKFRHKTLGWIAQEKIDNKYRVFVGKNGLEMDVVDWIPKELIENSQDREEVVEQPPKRMRDVIEAYNKNYTHLNDHKLIQALEKHCPPLQKKFTEEDIVASSRKEMYRDTEWFVILNEIKYFLKTNGLLEE